MGFVDEIKMMTAAILESSKRHNKNRVEIQKRIDAGELPKFKPTLAADAHNEMCHWKTLYTTDDRSAFDTACGHLVVHGGRPMLGSSKCGYCNRKIICDASYVNLWKATHPDYEWKTD